jgi:anoctamin-10/anoctamin-7
MIIIIIIIIIITIINIVNRPEFEGEPSHHPVDGRNYLHFPHKTYIFRQGVSYIMIFILIIIVLIVIIGLFVIRILLENSFTFYGIALGPILVGLIMAVQIQVLNLLYEMIAVKLNDYENHRTDTKYEDSLIGKTFLFQFINSFANMYYIAFVKPYIPTIDPCYPSCLQTLQTSLGKIYLFLFLYVF